MNPVPPPATPKASTGVSYLDHRLNGALGGSFVAFVLSFTWWRVSDNLVDNDLWGHVLYGGRALVSGRLAVPETLSWTAEGLEWINHEFGAEYLMTGAHRLGGGIGLWLGMVLIASLTLALALWEGRRGAVSRMQRLMSWGLLAVSANAIASGFSVRPQLFTTLLLVITLIQLRRLAQGRRCPLVLLPVVIGCWVNLHGGVFAGLFVIAVMALGELFSPWLGWLPGDAWDCGPRKPVQVLLNLLTLALSIAALWLNPWGGQMVEWVAISVQMARPDIYEWQPLALSFANLPFFAMLAVSVWAWFVSTEKRKPWEAVVLCLLAIMAVKHQRHAPLFALANLALSPAHLASAWQRQGPLLTNLSQMLRSRVMRGALSCLLLAGAFGACWASVSSPREHFYRIEVPRDLYPVSAIHFVREKQLSGRMITFFDWGQQVLWELPDCPVSFDGRLDTLYPAAIRDAHWEFYRGASMGPAVEWDKAELALLPSSCGGVRLLLGRGWRLVYADPLAVVLVRPGSSCAAKLPFPVVIERGLDAVQGREPFPDDTPVLAGPQAPR